MEYGDRVNDRHAIFELFRLDLKGWLEVAVLNYLFCKEWKLLNYYFYANVFEDHKNCYNFDDR